jgi:hypothetical protein
MKKTILFLGVIAIALTSCNGRAEYYEAQNKRLNSLQTEGLDRLMVEECGMYEIIKSKGIAIDTSISTHPTRWKQAYYKLNADSTRYVMCH